MTQHSKIIELCKDGEFHCQASFWQISKSPHKRRSEIEKRGYKFTSRKCEHGIKNAFDYKMSKVEPIHVAISYGNYNVEYPIPIKTPQTKLF